MDKMLDNGVAIVTGAGRGIGAASACRLATGGARTIVNHRSNPDGANEIVEVIEKAGGTAKAVKADVGHPDAVVALFDDVNRPSGRSIIWSTTPPCAAIRRRPTRSTSIAMKRFSPPMSADRC